MDVDDSGFDHSQDSSLHAMRIVTIGDVMLDVIVRPQGEFQVDDDVDASIVLAPGGQAANVATWAVDLGVAATVIGPRGDTPAARLVAERLDAKGVGFIGVGEGVVGTVVSIVRGRTRTMASDSGHQGWLGSLQPALLPSDATSLHVSGYPLLRAWGEPTPLPAVCAAARQRGVHVSVDLSSAAMIDNYDPASFASTVAELAPDVVFANADEWRAVRTHWRPAATVVVKDGAREVTVIHRDGTETVHATKAARAVDPTGAGDALAAGYLVGGIDVGIEAARRCVASVGAQPT
jgi:sugar/nucleoside kinase (ribokinase family)